MTLPHIDPYDLQYWAREHNLMWDTVAEIAMLTLLAGADSGRALLPVGVAQLADVDIFNRAALDFLQAYRLSTISDITETTRGLVVKAIQDWITEGGAMPALEASLTPIFGETRAGMIATTEVTRIYSQGNQIAWQSTGAVTEKRWMTARDERVCPICGPLHDTVVSIEGNWFIPNRGQVNEVFVPGPPAHPRCRCWLQPIVSVAEFKDQINRVLGLSIDDSQAVDYLKGIEYD